MAAKTFARKKTLEILKKELLNLLLRKSEMVKEREFNIQNIIDQREAIDIIKCYEEIIKTIRYNVIHGQMLKK